MCNLARSNILDMLKPHPRRLLLDYAQVFLFNKQQNVNMILWYIAYFVACLLVGVYGSDRRFGFLGSFAGSILITPLIMFFILALTKQTSVQQKQ